MERSTKKRDGRPLNDCREFIPEKTSACSVRTLTLIEGQPHKLAVIGFWLLWFRRFTRICEKKHEHVCKENFAVCSHCMGSSAGSPGSEIARGSFCKKFARPLDPVNRRHPA